MEESQSQWVFQLPLLVTTNQRLLFLLLLHFLLDPSLTAALRSVPLWLNPSQSLGNSQVFWGENSDGEQDIPLFPVKF